jgi:hypothetical protein
MINDSILNLSHIGYNPIKLPRENITPLLILIGKKNNLEIIGSLKYLTTSSKPIPTVTYDQTTSDITGKRIKISSLNAIVSILSGFLSQLGIAAAGAKSVYMHASKSDVIFENVLLDAVDKAEVIEFLDSVQPKEGGFLAHIGKQENMYIITEILKSNKFGVIAYNENGKAVGIELSAIKTLADISGNFKVYNEDSGVVWYEGQKYLTFAFKALPFRLTKGQRNSFQCEIISPEDLALKGLKVGSSKDNEMYVVFAPDELVDLGFKEE